jgi:hypothetical protein
MLRPDRIAELMAAYQAGDSTYVLARSSGAKRETISKHLEQAGVAQRSGRDVERHRTDSPAEIRTWARANGYKVSDRGRIPAVVKWACAHSSCRSAQIEL